MHIQLAKRILSRLEPSLLDPSQTSSKKVLDFGCGAGATVYGWRDEGYNCHGFDIKDYLSLRETGDRQFFHIGFPSHNRLPFDDNSFDLVVSNQVFEHVKDQAAMLKELHRIMKPGAVSLHVFPARYAIIEPHIYVPLGGVLAHRWWYHLWALLGIRNEFQKGLSAAEVADRNCIYFVEGLNYVPNSCYEAVWSRLGFDFSYLEQAILETSQRPISRILGAINRGLPLLSWLNRTFNMRCVSLRKMRASTP